MKCAGGGAEPQVSANDAPDDPNPCAVRIPANTISTAHVQLTTMGASQPTDLMPAVTLVFSRHHTRSSGTQCGHKTDPSAHLCKADGSPVLPGGGNSHGAHEAEAWCVDHTPPKSGGVCSRLVRHPKILEVPLEININTKIQKPPTSTSLAPTCRGGGL